MQYRRQNVFNWGLDIAKINKISLITSVSHFILGGLQHCLGR